MTTASQLRKTALSLPETVERKGSSGATAFLVHDTPFAALTSDKLVELHLATEDADRVRAEHPTAEPLTDAGSRIGVRVPITDINGQQLNHWVRRAWLAHAPEPLAARNSAADTAVAGQVGDLPKAIGNPATRALVAQGITTLAQVAALSDAELRELHGIGPKAIRILDAAIAAGGYR